MTAAGLEMDFSKILLKSCDISCSSKNAVGGLEFETPKIKKARTGGFGPNPLTGPVQRTSLPGTFR